MTKKGRVDSTGLAKYFPMRQGKGSPRELAESLGAFYQRTDVTMLGDPGQNEFGYPGFIACGLSFEATAHGLVCWKAALL